jgi:hypothetical protein
MSNLAYDTVKVEQTLVEQAATRRPKPFVVPCRGWDGGDSVARRVAQVLELQLAQGAMPA